MQCRCGRERLTHIWRRLCVKWHSDIEPSAIYTLFARGADRRCQGKGRLPYPCRGLGRLLKGAMLAQKALQGSQTKTKSCWEEQKRIVFLLYHSFTYLTPYKLIVCALPVSCLLDSPCSHFGHPIEVKVLAALIRELLKILLPLAFLKLAIEMFSSKNNPLCEHEIL